MGLETAKAISSLGETLFETGVGLADTLHKTEKKISKYLIGAQVSHEVDKIFAEAKRNPNANAGIAEFKNSFVGLAKGIRDSVSDGEDKLYANSLLAHGANQAMGHLQATAVKQNFHTAQYQIAQAIDKYTEQADKTAFSGDLKGALGFKSEINKMLLPAVEQGLISPHTAISLEKQTEESIGKNHYLGLYSKFAEANDAEGMNAVVKKIINDKSLSIKSKNQTLSLVNKVRAGISLSMDLDGKAAALLKGDVVWQAKTQGKHLSSEQIAQLQIQLPKKAKQIQLEVEDGIEEHSIVESQKFTPLSKRAEFITLLDEQIHKETDHRKVKLLKNAQERLSEEIKTIKDNPALYVRRLNSELELIKPEGTIDARLKEYQNTPEYQALSEREKDRALKQKRASFIIEMEKSLELPISLLPKNEAEAIVAELKNKTAATQINYLKAQQDLYRQYAPIIIKDLEKAKLPAETKIGLTVHPAFSNVFADAIKNKKELKDLSYGKRLPLDKEIKARIDKDNAEFFRTLAPEEANDYKEVIYLSTKQMIHNSDKGINKAAKEAKENIYNYKYSYIKDGFRVPKSVGGKTIDYSDVKNTMKKYLAEIQKTNNVLLKEGISQKENMALLLNGSWKTLPDDSGVYYVAADGEPVRKKNGEIHHISFLGAEK